MKTVYPENYKAPAIATSADDAAHQRDLVRAKQIIEQATATEPLTSEQLTCLIRGKRFTSREELYAQTLVDFASVDTDLAAAIASVKARDKNIAAANGCQSLKAKDIEKLIDEVIGARESTWDLGSGRVGP